MPEQLAFDLPVRTALGRGDFFVSEANALAVARLDAPGDWPSGKLALTGPEGAGKTHLAHAWAEAQRARLLTPADLAALDPAAVASPVVLDDADQVAPDAEEALFHLHNHLAAARLPFLLIGREAPARWPVALPDLKSRMAAADTVRIAPPDDRLLGAVLVKLFADRQLAISPALVPWLVARAERSFAALQRIVAALDAAALAEKRAITRPLAQQVLDKMAEDGR